MEGMEEIVQEFLVESHENLDQLDQDLLALERDPTSRDLLSSIFRTLHTIKGTSGFLALHTLERVAHAGESLLSKLRDGELTLNPQMATALLEMVDAVRNLLEHIEQDGNEGDQQYVELTAKLHALLEGRDLSTLESAQSAPAAAQDAETGSAAAAAQAASDAAQAASQAADAAAEAASQAQVAEVAAVAVAQEAHVGAAQSGGGQSGVAQTGAAESGASGAAAGPGEGTPAADGPATAAEGAAAPAVPTEPKEAAQAAAAAQSAAASASAAPAKKAEGDGAKPTRSVADQSIRVDVDLLDSLMNLVGELVLSRNQLVQRAAASQNQELQRSMHRLSLVASELQEGVMKTRMQPIENVWSKIPRVVRDLANSLGRQIRVEMEGKDTELDKTILEAIKDPLTHLVRNSCDHGIEPPDVRVAKGKPAEGVLLMKAFHEGGQVNIEIVDDGAGINTERSRTRPSSAAS